MNARTRSPHLTDAELFTLALPPAGEPEALPSHLLECAACGRALQTWKVAVRDLAREDAGPMERRSEREWRAAEDRTLAAIRGARVGRRFPVAWAASLAAAVLVGALLVPSKPGASPAPAVRPVEKSAELSPADQADDLLLREANVMARGDAQATWEPFPSDAADAPRGSEKRL
jgi:hypothetical protein